MSIENLPENNTVYVTELSWNEVSSSMSISQPTERTSQAWY